MANTQAPSLTDMPRPSGPWEYADAEEGYDYIASVQCNKICYVDDDGKSHERHIPTGKAAEACQHFVNKNWEELATLPTWEGQQYTDEDYTITKYKKNPLTEAEKEGTIVKKVGDPLVKTADGKVVLGRKEANVGE